MTNSMEQAIDALRHVPADQQDKIALVVRQFTGVEPSTGLYVPVRAIWAKHGL